MNRFLLAFTILWLVSQGNCDSHHRFRHRLSSTRCRKCVPGWGVVSMCSASENTVCSPCTLGYYSHHHSYKQACLTCSRCGDGLYVAHECSPTRDTICDSCETFRGPHNEDFVHKCSVTDSTGEGSDVTKELASSSPAKHQIEHFSSPKSLFFKISRKTVPHFTTETKEKTKEFSAKDETQQRGVATIAVRSTIIAVGVCILILLFAALVKNFAKNDRPSTSTYDVLPEAC